MKARPKPATAIVDSTVILNLASAGLLSKLCRLVGTIYVPVCVRRETKLYGRQRHRPDVERFKRRTLHCNEWDNDTFLAALATFRQQNPRRSNRGEAEMIAQAARRKVSLVLTDDRDAAQYAALRGLEVWATPLILVKIAATSRR